MSFFLEQPTQKAHLPDILFNNTDGTNSVQVSVNTGCLDCDKDSGKEENFADQFTLVVIIFGCLFSVFYTFFMLRCTCWDYITRDKDAQSPFLVDKTEGNVMGVDFSPKRNNNSNNSGNDDKGNCVELSVVNENNLDPKNSEHVKTDDERLDEEMC